MIVVYRDETGIVSEKTDMSIAFADGLVYIGNHVINITDLIEIAENPK